MGKYNTLGPRTRMGEGMSLPCRNAVIDGLSGVRKNVWGIFQILKIGFTREFASHLTDKSIPWMLSWVSMMALGLPLENIEKTIQGPWDSIFLDFLGDLELHHRILSE